MKKAILAISAALILAGPQPALAAEAATYDDAIRCASVDTLISAVIGGDNASAEDKATSEYYDSVTDKWLTRASEARPDSALTDYLTKSTTLAEKLANASNEDEMMGLLIVDLLTCTQLEQATFGTSPPGFE